MSVTITERSPASSSAAATEAPKVKEQGTPNHTLADGTRALAQAREASNGRAFTAHWNSLRDSLADHGVDAPKAPWVGWNSKPIEGAIEGARQAPGFKPVARSTINAATNFVRAAHTPTTDPNFDRAFGNELTGMMAMVRQQAFAPPKEISLAAAPLEAYSQSKLKLTREQVREYGLALANTIGKYAND